MADETSDASQQQQPPPPEQPHPQTPPAAEPPPAQPPPAPWAAPAPPQWPAPGQQPYQPSQPYPQAQQPYQPSQPYEQAQQPYQPYPPNPPQPPGGWPYPPPAGYGTPPPAPPAQPFGLTPRFIAAIVAAGLVVGVAVALPIALIGRNTQPSSATPGGGSANPSSTPASGASAAARSAYQQALAATRAAKGVHYVAVTSGGAANQHTTGDAGQATGTQDITVTSSYGAEQFKLLLIDGVVYFQGNVPAEEDQVGLSPADAQRLAGKWITVVRGDGPYTILQPGITTADQAAEMPMVAATTEQVTAAGKKATRIHGTTPATAEIPGGTAYMDVDPSTHLPITYVSTVTAGNVTVTATTNFSNWGTPPSPSAPADTVKWSTLNATEPPGGYGSGGGGGQGTPAPA